MSEAKLIFSASNGSAVGRNESGIVSVGGGEIMIHEMAEEIERLRACADAAGDMLSWIEGSADLSQYDIDNHLRKWQLAVLNATIGGKRQ